MKIKFVNSLLLGTLLVMAMPMPVYAATPQPHKKLIRQVIQCPSFKGIYQLKDSPVIDGWTLWLPTAHPVAISTKLDAGYVAQRSNADVFIHDIPADQACRGGRILLSCVGSTNEGFSYILNKLVVDAHRCTLGSDGRSFVCICDPSLEAFAQPRAVEDSLTTKPEPIVLPVQ